MFGYVRAYKAELRFKEYDTYKAIYCSLCRYMGKHYGLMTRLTLNYDFAFLSLVAISLSDKCAGFEKKRCVVNPLKGCLYCKDDADFDYPAAVAIALTYNKILDNCSDKKGIKRLLYKLAAPYFKRQAAKAFCKFPFLEQIADNYMLLQKRVEGEKSDSIDKAGEPTANALGLIFKQLSTEYEQQLFRMGYCIGKWIYLVDACEDFTDDIKTGSYNPIKESLTAREIDDNNDSELMILAKERCEPTMYVCLCEAAAAYELIEFKRYKEIIDNVLYFGLKNSQNLIFKKEKTKNNERSV